MFGFHKSSPVAEHEATGEVERVYHEIRQTLRVSGVNLNFRSWAGFDGLLPLLWSAIQPNAETWLFEESADKLRRDAARAAETLGRLDVVDRVKMGESRTFQLAAAIRLYHYVNPKLLLLTSAVRMSLEGEGVARDVDKPSMDRIALGIPPQMYPMEMEDEDPADETLRDVFADIQQTLSIDQINSDYRTLALWPDYLTAMWPRLKGIVQQTDYDKAVTALRERSQFLAARLPLPVPLSQDVFEQASVDYDNAVTTARSFERLLPGLIVNMALCLHDWHDGEELASSPFPAQRRAAVPHREPQPEGAV